METSEQVIGGKEKEELNGAREAEVCSGGLVQLLYVLSVTCRSLLIVERQKVRMFMCGRQKQGAKLQRYLHLPRVMIKNK